jgi:hypothetical protein
MPQMSYAAIAAAAKPVNKPNRIQAPFPDPIQRSIAPSSSEATPAPIQSRRAFVSGPLEPPPDYFNKHYIPRLLAALSTSDSFLIGPSRGIDSLTLSFLRSKNCDPARLNVYFTTSEYHKTRVGLRKELESAGIRAVAAGRNHTERDEAMTKASDYDILRYLTKQECMELFGENYRERVSGTELNEMRRVALGAVAGS